MNLFFNRKLIPKPILFSKISKIYKIFHDHNSVDCSEYEVQGSDFGVWSQLINYISIDEI